MDHYGGGYGGGGYDRDRKSGGYGGGGYGGGGHGGSSGGGSGASLQAISDWSGASHFEKNFYQEHPAVTARADADIAAFRASKQIVVTGRDPPKPCQTFEEGSFPDYILNVVEKEYGLQAAPTPVQAQAWPVALSGRDCINVAETGSGKTLAFMLPAIVHINAQPYLQPGDGPIALMMAPTRELALQIHEVGMKYGQSSNIKLTCVYGGAPKGPQAGELRRGVEIVVATPGRLIDFLESRTTNLRRVTYLVMDEADRSVLLLICRVLAPAGRALSATSLPARVPCWVTPFAPPQPPSTHNSPPHPTPPAPPAGCSTWASNRKSARSWARSALTAKPSCNPRPLNPKPSNRKSARSWARSALIAKPSCNPRPLNPQP